MKKSKLGFVIGIFLVVGFSGPGFAKKKSGGGKGSSGPARFSISPSSYDLKCTPGEKKTLILTITNLNSSEAQATLSPLGYVIDKNGGLASQSLASLPANSLARHMVLESPVIALSAHASKKVPIVLDIPEGLSGTQYAGFIVANNFNDIPDDVDRPEEYTSEVGIGFSTAIALNIKCQMQGEELVHSYTVEKMLFVPAKGNEAPTVQISVKNTGNAEIQFFPILVLLDSAQKAVARLKGKTLVTIYPGTSQMMEMAAPFTRIPSGTYDAVLTMVNSEQSFEPSQQKLTVGN